MLAKETLLLENFRPSKCDGVLCKWVVSPSWHGSKLEVDPLLKSAAVSDQQAIVRIFGVVFSDAVSVLLWSAQCCD